ncbi:MAG: hypothetical protein PHV51_11100, partial [Methanosarcinaceae archaeon]|nr:hypothetical protein [Methanosarcinaceae archaeon]
MVCHNVPEGETETFVLLRDVENGLDHVTVQATGDANLTTTTGDIVNTTVEGNVVTLDAGGNITNTAVDAAS